MEALGQENHVGMIPHCWIVLPLKTTLNTLVRKIIAFVKRFLKALFGTLLGSGALLILSCIITLALFLCVVRLFCTFI